MDDVGKIMYPEMEEVQRQEEEEKQGATEGKPKEKTAAQVLYPQLEENKDYDLQLGDPETRELKEALDLFENQKHQELADLVEQELNALKAGPEEIGLFSFARKHASDSPEWADWIRKAVRNLYQQKRAYRLYGQD